MTPKPQFNKPPTRSFPKKQPSMAAAFLSDDIWQYIGFKLPVADRIRFRAVCKTWASLLPSRHPPWLMLSEPQHPQLVDEEQPIDRPAPNPNPNPPPPPRRGFVSLGEQEIHEIDFPEAHQSRCVGSTGNWLVTVNYDKSIRLLNPFSREHLDLPPRSGFDNSVDRRNEELSQIELWKVVLSSPPSEGGDCIAMAIHHFKKILAIARPGDARWTTVEIDNPKPSYTIDVLMVDHVITYTLYVEVDDVIFYKGQFYAITTRGELLVCDIGDGQNPPKASYLTKPIEEYSIYRVTYLVEWSGELLAVLKFVDMDGIAYQTTKFVIYRFDFVDRKWHEVRSLGEYSLFLGFNTSVALRASDYLGLMRKNCVYFTDDFVFGYIDITRNLDVEQPGGLDMGVFDLEDKSITPHFIGLSVSLYSPPVWVVPT